MTGPNAVEPQMEQLTPDDPHSFVPIEPNAVGGEVVQADRERAWDFAEKYGPFTEADKGAFMSGRYDKMHFVTTFRDHRLAHTPAGEREQIVAWLRGQAEAGDKALLNALDGSQLRRDLAAGVVAINRAADSLERGDHLTTDAGEGT